MKRRTEETKRRIKSSVLLISFIAILLIISTYAWFSAQNDVYILNLEGKVEVVDSLEISLDAKIWSQTIDLSQYSLDTDAYTGHNNIVPTDLTPVSTLGAVGGKTVSMLCGTGDDSALNNIIECEEDLSIDRDSNRYPGYFAFDLFIKNTSRVDKDNTLSLVSEKSTITVLQPGNIFSRRGDDNSGLQNTIRLAIAQYSGTASATLTDPASIIAITNAESSLINKVAIWEPNSNFHVDQIVRQNNKLLTDSPTDLGLTAEGKFTRTSQIGTYALNSSAKGESIENVYDWTSANTMVSKQNVLQTTIEVPEDGAMPASYLMRETNPVLVEASNGTTPFTIPSNKIIKTRIYIWLEGQDVDCINHASKGGGIEVNLGIMKDIITN